MAVTIHEMTKTPFVLGLFSRLKAPGLALSQFYGIGPNGTPTETTNKNSLVYDLFDNTRTLMKGRGPYVGPGKTPPKRVGQGTAHLMRAYEAIPFLYQKIYGMRPLGGQIGEMDPEGRVYVGRQQKFMAQRMMNMVEFTVSRMFRGGYSITIDGDDWYLGEKGAGTIDVDFGIPAGHLTDCAVGGTNGSTAIFSGQWDDPATDVIGELMDLNKASERITGFVQKHVWINSTTYQYLLANTGLRSVGGNALTIFDTQTQKEISTTDAPREQGYYVVFRALPQFQFHVYDAVHHAGSVLKDSDTFSELPMYIPDNKALITPDPGAGDWYGMAVGVEPVKENDIAPVQYVTGLHSWAYPTNDPPGFEWRMLYNWCPLLYNPRAHFYATVSTP